MKLQAKILLAATAPLFMFMTCRKGPHHGDTPIGNPKSNCEQVICTQMFAMVTVEVTQAGVTPQFDDVYTIRTSNNQKITPEQTMGSGHFVVLDDSYLKNLQNKTETFRFIAVKNGVNVIDEPYTISADCCHIKKDSGKDAINL